MNKLKANRIKISTAPLLILLTVSCNNQTNEAALSKKTGTVKSVAPDSVSSTTIIKNISDSSITNTTDRTVDILFNGVDNYLGGHQDPKARFATECTICLPVQAYRNGFLFGKSLFVTKDSTIIFDKNQNISDTAGIVKMRTYYGERKLKTYKFSEGKLSMKYQGQSCNDAGFVNVKLEYETGVLSFDKLINASFFEFDLDKDGRLEQFLMGRRNCSQELVVLRINNKKNDN